MTYMNYMLNLSTQEKAQIDSQVRTNRRLLRESIIAKVKLIIGEKDFKLLQRGSSEVRLSLIEVIRKNKKTYLKFKLVITLFGCGSQIILQESETFDYSLSNQVPVYKVSNSLSSKNDQQLLKSEELVFHQYINNGDLTSRHSELLENQILEQVVLVKRNPNNSSKGKSSLFVEGFSNNNTPSNPRKSQPKDVGSNLKPKFDQAETSESPSGGGSNPPNGGNSDFEAEYETKKQTTNETPIHFPIDDEKKAETCELSERSSSDSSDSIEECLTDSEADLTKLSDPMSVYKNYSVTDRWNTLVKIPHHQARSKAYHMDVFGQEPPSTIDMKQVKLLRKTEEEYKERFDLLHDKSLLPDEDVFIHQIRIANFINHEDTQRISGFITAEKQPGILYFNILTRQVVFMDSLHFKDEEIIYRTSASLSQAQFNKLLEDEFHLFPNR